MQVKTMIKRLQKLMPYRDIAEELHVSISAVGYWASGGRVPKFHTTEAIKKLYEKYI